MLDGLDLTIPAGTSLAIVGQNGAGKTTLAKLLCRLYDPTGGPIEIDGIDLRDLDLAAWRQHVTAVFQDFVRYELPLRDNVAPEGGADDEAVRAALAGGRRRRTWPTSTRRWPRATPAAPTSRAGSGSGSRSPAPSTRVATGAGVVLLDEPTAQLDVRGRAGDLRAGAAGDGRAGRRSSSRTASRPCAWPTASASSSTAGSSSSATTTS